MTAPVPSDPSLVEILVAAGAMTVDDASEARADAGGVSTAARIVPTPLDVEVSRELQRLAHDRHLEVPGLPRPAPDRRRRHYPRAGS